MASYLYGKGRGRLIGHATAQINLITNDIKVLLADGADYTPDQDVDEFHADIAGAGIVATSGNMSSKTTTLGAYDAADTTWTGVTGDEFEFIIGYKDSGSSATSPLIWKIDDYTGLPATPNGTNITAIWPSGGIFIA